MSSLISKLYEFAEFHLDPQNRVLRRAGTPVPLTPKAFDLLLALVQNGERVVTKDELMKAVWPDSFVEESNLTQTIFMVRKALEETGDRRYILNVQGKGYRFLIPVIERVANGQEIEVPLSSPGPESAREVPSHPGRFENKKLAAIASALALVLLLASATWFWHSRRGPARQPAKIMLAVLPFENFTGDSAQEYFSDGLTEELISQLGNVDSAHLGVIARTSVMHYKHSQTSIPQIGKDLGVQYVIEGSVRRDSERVRITAQLIEVNDQSHLWTREYDRDLGHMLDLQDEIARGVANEIEFSLSGRRPIQASREGSVLFSGTKSYEAYDLYLRGRYCWNKRTGDGFRQAAGYFQQAIDKDANYGKAYAGLADTFSLMSTWYIGPQNELMPKARTAALRALALDDGLAEAHASLALIKENYDYDWAGSEKEFRRAIQLNPQYATAHQWYAEFLSWQGRFPEAFAESERARQLDPLSLIIARDHAWILYYSRQYDSAVKQFHSLLDLDPNFERARNELIPSYLQMGKYDEAIEAADQWAGGETPWMWAWKAAVYGRAGRTGDARKMVANLERLPDSRPDRCATLLIGYLGADEKDQEIQLLKKAYSEHSNAVVQLKADPIYDPLRTDPRFQDLLRHLGLEK